MLANPHLGEYVANECPRCRKVVRSHLERRSVRLARTRLVVTDVIVDVCPVCDHTISIAPESVEQLREAGWSK